MGHPCHDHQVVEAQGLLPVTVVTRRSLSGLCAFEVYAALRCVKRAQTLSMGKHIELIKVPFVRAHEHVLKPIELLVLVSYACCHASTSSLSTWWSSTALKGYLVLRGASRLDAFSGYPVRI